MSVGVSRLMPTSVRIPLRQMTSRAVRVWQTRLLILLVPFSCYIYLMKLFVFFTHPLHNRFILSFGWSVGLKPGFRYQQIQLMKPKRNLK